MFSRRSLLLAAVLGGPAASACAADILIGQVSSQTSPVTAANAKALYAGINVYFSYVNEHGGVDGRKVVLVN